MLTSAKSGAPHEVYVGAAGVAVGSRLSPWARPAPQAKASAATMMPLSFLLKRWSPNLLAPTTSLVKASDTLITRPPHLFKLSRNNRPRPPAGQCGYPHTRGLVETQGGGARVTRA